MRVRRGQTVGVGQVAQKSPRGRRAYGGWRWRMELAMEVRNCNCNCNSTTLVGWIMEMDNG